jgi:uncharacterized coiled-coil DUF342 family protein
VLEIGEHMRKLTAERDALKVDCRNKDFVIDELSSELDAVKAQVKELQSELDSIKIK